VGYNTEGPRRWAASARWRDAFNETVALHMGAANEFELDQDELVTILGDRINDLLNWAFEDLASDRPETGPNFIDDYLKRRGWKESAGARGYLAALRDSVMSIYEVSEIEPGVSFKARDLVRGGDPVVVFERTATRIMQPWDRIAFRMVEVNGKTMASGAALHLTRDACERALSDLTMLRERLRSESANRTPEVAAAITAFVLHGAAAIVSAAWLRDLLDRLIGNRQPMFVNAEGDPIEFLIVRYGLRPGVTHDQLREALAGMSELRDDGYDWQWVIQSDTTSVSDDAGTTIGKAGVRGFGNESIFASIELDGRNLLVTVNSPKRAETVIQRFAAPLAGLVGEPSLEEAAEEDDGTATDPTDVSDRELSDEVLVAFGELMDEHYRRTLRQPLPFIGGEKPLDAVKTEEGRRKVAEWLKFLENTAARHASLGTSYDLGWMWDELGLHDYRK
jgi:hypothetical protein